MIFSYLSNTLKGAFDAVAERIAGSRDRRHIVIVPDKFTLSTERSILAALKVEGAFDIDVVSFERLADKLLPRVACLTPESAVMLLRRVVDENKSKFKCYRNSSGSTGFAHEMYAVMTAIRNSNISVDLFKKAMPKLSGFVRNKAEDIATIYDGYMSALSSYNDVTTRMDALIEAIPDADGIGEIEFSVLEHFSFTAKELKIIEQLAKYARRVNVGLVMDDNYPNARIFPYRVLDRLKSIAKVCGVPYEQTYVRYKVSAPFDTLERNIFAYSKPDKQSAQGKVKIYEAQNVYDETTFVVRRIRKLVNDGLRYKDVAVVCGDIAGYTPAFIRLFNRYGIPFFIDRKSLLAEQVISDYVCQWLKLNIYGVKASDMIALFKNPLSQVDRYTAESIENFFIKRNVIYVPEGFVAETKEQSELIARTARVAKELLAGKATARELSERLKKFLDGDDTVAKNESYAKSLDDSGDTISASQNAQAGAKLTKIIEDTGEFMGATEYTAEEFYLTLVSVCNAAKISVIPQYADGVYIGECRESRYINVKAMFITGATDGNVPAESDGASILSERELAEYREQNIEIEPSARTSNMEEKLFVQQLLLKPSGELNISFPATDASGASVLPSTLVKECRKLLYNNGDGFAVLTAASFDPSMRDESDRAELIAYNCGTTDGAFYEYADFLGVGENRRKSMLSAVRTAIEADDKHRLDRLEHPIMQADKLSTSLFDGGHIYVSKLETYFVCPYKHFLRYGLKAEKREEGSLSGIDIGNFLHATAERYVKRRDIGGEIKALTEQIIAELLKDERFAFCATGHNAVIIERLINEAYRVTEQIEEQLRHSRFVPKLAEWQFGRGGQAPVTLTDGERNIKFCGVVDRIDEYGDSFVIIDYKSGAIHSELKNVYFGQNIQLYLYLDIVKSVFGKKPAGAFYFKLRDDYVNLDSKESGSQLLYGQLLDEVAENRSFDDGIGEQSSAFTGLKVGKKGFVPEVGVFSTPDFENACGYVKRISLNAANEMKDGYIAQKPVKDECDYCDYQEICRGGNVREREQKGTVKKGSFAEVDNEKVD